MNTIKIKPVKLGLPSKEGNCLLVRPIIHSTQSKSCSIYYEVISKVSIEVPSTVEGGEPTYSNTREVLTTGNLDIDEEQYDAWGADNSFIEDVVLKKLGLERALTK